MKYKILLTILLLWKFGFTQSCGTFQVHDFVMPACNNEEYELVFSDDFNGNSLDTTLWKPWIGVPRDFPFLQQKAWHTRENIEVGNGTLKLIGKKLESPYTGEWCTKWDANTGDCIETKTSTFDYTSGEIWTNQSFFYGKYEALCRLPAGKGFWPAFWVYGGQSQSEIDFFEIYGDDVNRYTCNVYNGMNSYGNRPDCSFADNLSLTFFTSWHTFTCIFDPFKIIFLIDNVPIREYYRYKTSSLLFNHTISCGDEIDPEVSLVEQRAWPTDNMFMVLNLAIQNGENAPNSSTVFPGVFEIDWVKVYTKPTPSCIDCISQMNYNESFFPLPELTMTNDLITASVGIDYNENVTFKSEKITLQPGFSAVRQSNFLASIQKCNQTSSYNNPIQFQIEPSNGNNLGSTAISIYKCINPILSFYMSGITYYECEIRKVGENDLYYSVYGEPVTNKVNIWNVSNVPNGYYNVNVKLKNCHFTDVRKFIISVENGNCKINNTSEDSNYFLEQNETELSVFPNPSINKVYIEYENGSNMKICNINIFDTNGKKLLNVLKQLNNGINTYEFDISNFSNGIYFISLEDNSKTIMSKFIILK